MGRTRRSTNVRSIAKMAELAVAAPQVIAARTARMMAAGANPGAADRAEFARMWTEKTQAFWESLFAMGVQMARVHQEYATGAAMQWTRLWTAPWWLAATTPTLASLTRLPRVPALLRLPSTTQSTRAVSRVMDAGLGPVHRRATANARRLTRKRRRRPS